MACVILTAVALQPGLPAILVILFASGLCDSYQVQANAAFVAAVPDSLRGQAFGLALGGMQLGQGTAMVLAGGVAQHAGPAPVIAVTGAAGAAAAVVISLSRSVRPDLSPSRVPHRGPPICLAPEPAQLKTVPPNRGKERVPVPRRRGRVHSICDFAAKLATTLHAAGHTGIGNSAVTCENRLRA